MFVLPYLALPVMLVTAQCVSMCVRMYVPLFVSVFVQFVLSASTAFCG
jgi:hypothetical protein